MKVKKITGKIEFSEKEYKIFNRTFTAKLTTSPGFEYGNGTCVVIEFGKLANGERPEGKMIDTRYSIDILQDFEKWLKNWFSENYCKHVLIID